MSELRPVSFAELAHRRVFFGHQSVGANLLDGLIELAAEERASLRVVETGDPSALVPGTLAHALVAENGDPLQKLRSFERLLDSGIGDVADVALVKFCYVDFASATDATALFASYQEMLARQRSRHPRLVFVHVTVPLTTVQGGFKAMMKRALGRSPAGLAENARRDEYNELLRRAFAGKEPVFDLARLESMTPDGTLTLIAEGARRVPALAPENTDDGGHLNREARVRLARELVPLLASAR